ncbi:unnamed protein product [Ceratitis capitata]|uniref:(Mediterranean fruit fly) hypothetical protein n=1 Tax=Ceratitis capitata TaxID=7213 RepID=A0A811V162_CERCA|nr:unnamed protein product [Ceratitis capitata]
MAALLFAEITLKLRCAIDTKSTACVPKSTSTAHAATPRTLHRTAFARCSAPLTLLDLSHALNVSLLPLCVEREVRIDSMNVAIARRRIAFVVCEVGDDDYDHGDGVVAHSLGHSVS